MLFSGVCFCFILDLISAIRCVFSFDCGFFMWFIGLLLDVLWWAGLSFVLYVCSVMFFLLWFGCVCCFVFNSFRPWLYCWMWFLWWFL